MWHLCLLSIRRLMNVVAAGVMCHLTMDTSLVKVLNTITLATYQPFFFIVIDFVLNYPKLSKLIHCLVSLTCTKFNVQFRTCRMQNK